MKWIANKLCNASLHIPKLYKNNNYEKHFGSDYSNNFEELQQCPSNIVCEYKLNIVDKWGEWFTSNISQNTPQFILFMQGKFIAVNLR